MKERGRRPVQGRKKKECFMEETGFYLDFEGWMGNECKEMREKGVRGGENPVSKGFLGLGLCRSG